MRGVERNSHVAPEGESHVFRCPPFRLDSAGREATSYRAVQAVTRACGSAQLADTLRSPLSPCDRALEGLESRFRRFSKGLAGVLRSGNHSVSDAIPQYLWGLMWAEKRNMKRMVELVPESACLVLQNLLTHSSWDYRPVMDRVASKADALVGGQVGTGPFIDESALAKKGDQAVGETRHWNDRLGKQNNCQVGVLGALGWRDLAALTDSRLQLSKDGTDDPCRCERTDVPRAHLAHRTKLQLAQRIIRHAGELGVRLDWDGVEGGCGKFLAFRQSLQDPRQTFPADIHSDRDIQLNDPAPHLPLQGQSRPRSRYHCGAQPVEVRKWVKRQPASAWRRKALREATNEELLVEALHRRVWPWDIQSPRARGCHLIVRWEVGSPGTIKDSLSSGPAGTSVVKEGAHAGAALPDRTSPPGCRKSYWAGAITRTTG